MTTFQGSEGDVTGWRLKVLEEGLKTLIEWRALVTERISRHSTKIEDQGKAIDKLLLEVQALRRTVMGLAISIATGSLAICLTLVLR